MTTTLDQYRATGGANMSRYRVGGATVLTIAENHRMTAGRILIVAGLVRVQGRLLFTADAATAKFNGATPMALANQWAQNMRAVLPSLTQPK